MQSYKKLAAQRILWLTDAQQRLAEVQSKLDENLAAWATLTQALALLQSPLLAESIELEGASNPCAGER